jgi:hypothetical protein
MSGDSSSFGREGVQARNAAKYAEHFFRRVPVVTPIYETDSGDLLPTPKKIGSLGVTMADASAVHIHAKPERIIKYEPTERPAIQFRGRLTIADLSDEEVPVEAAVDEEAATDRVQETEADAAEPVAVKTEVVAEADVESAAKAAAEVATSAHGHHEIPIAHLGGRGPLHKYTKAQLANLEPLSNPDGIIGEQRARIVDRNPRDRTLVVSAPLADSRTLSPFVVVVMGVIALVISVGLVGMHTTVTADANSLAEVYVFTFGSFVELVREQIAALLVHSFGR